jgi:iron complex transport system substrate-binding protein
VKAQIREMGDVVGHPDRASAEIARLDDAIARARQAVAVKRYRVLSCLGAAGSPAAIA